MTTNDTALATRNLSLADIGRRIELNKRSGWGLEKGSSAQLNLLALFCQKHNLLPGDDVTLYEGKPWITVDGRVKLMGRHAEYRGYSQRPLSKDEKEDWGYDPDDLVVATTIRTATMGEIVGYGKVSKAERAGTPVQGVRHNPVAKHHPVEMAQKRSLSRAERHTFGTEGYVDDEEVEAAAQEIIEQRADPERTRLLAAQQTAIFGSDDDGTAYADLPAERGELVEDEA